MVYLVQCKGRCSGITFVDATSLAVCNNPDCPHRFLRARRPGKTSMGGSMAQVHLIVMTRRIVGVSADQAMSMIDSRADAGP